VPIGHRMAILAAVLRRCRGELAVVGIFVAIGAGLKPDLVNGVLACRYVALGALHLGMPALQGVFRRVVFGHAKRRWLPTIHGMAFRAFALLGPRVELTLMRIGCVAVSARCEGNLFFEVSFEVTCGAGHGGVLAGERILGLGVIEVVPGQHRFPTVGSVAGFAGFLELASVRIEVAVRTRAELHVAIPGRAAGCVRLVALFAGYLNVQTGQRIASLGVVKVLAGLPTFHVVAFRALVAQLALMRIRVARRTRGGLPQKGFGRVLILDFLAELRNHVRWRVALLASQVRVFAFQSVTGQEVIEFFF